jgi:hypothetical protein
MPYDFWSGRNNIGLWLGNLTAFKPITPGWDVGSQEHGTND